MNGVEMLFCSFLVMLLSLVVVGGIALLVICLWEEDKPDPATTQLHKIHEQSIKDIDDVVSYYVGLQQYIADHVEELSSRPRESGPRSGR
jgi:hypothetical protein